MTEYSKLDSDRQPLAPVLAAVACFLLGYQATISQVLIIREFLVVFFGNELCLGVIFFSWFAGIAIGAYAASRLTDRIANPLSVFMLVELLFPVVLVGVIPLIRTARAWLGAPPGELIPFTKLFIATMLMVMPTTVLIGLGFPFACRALQSVRTLDGRRTEDTQTIGWTYVLESLGSLAGGVLFTFVLVQRLSSPETALVSVLIVSACLLLLALSLDQQVRGVRTAASCAGSVLLAAALAFVLGLATRIDDATALARWRSMGQKLDLVAIHDSRYQNLALGLQEDQYSLFTNGQYAFSFPDPFLPAQEANLFMCEHPDPKEILLIGGTPGMLGEILRHPVRSVHYLEIDPQVLGVIDQYLSPPEREALADQRVTVFYEDGRHFIKRNRSKRRYDLVILDLPDPSTAMLNRFYTREFFAEVKEVLCHGGVVVAGISSASTYFGEEMRSFSGSLYVTMRDSFAHLAISPGETNYFFASDSPNTPSDDADILAERYKSRGIESEHFSEYIFPSIFQPERVQFTRQSFEKASDLRINTDDTPITYFFNLILWSRYSGGTFGPILLRLSKIRFSWLALTMVVLLGLAGALLSRGKLNSDSLGQPLALVAIATTGMAAMAFDLTTLYAYQNTYGYLYQEIGLVVALFMTGLAAGGMSATRLLASRSSAYPVMLLVLEAMIALFALVLPGLLHTAGTIESVGAGKLFFLLVVVTAGAITGAEFPVANGVFMRAGGRMGASAALTESTDHLGAALGALLTGVLLLPLFGTIRTCVLLSLINILSAALIATWIAAQKRAIPLR